MDAGSIKVIRRDFYHSLSLESTSIFFEAEMIIRALKQERIVTTVPIHFKKIQSSGGGGNIHLVINSLKDLLSFRMKQLFSSRY
jgi:hypothetical protein